MTLFAARAGCIVVALASLYWAYLLAPAAYFITSSGLSPVGQRLQALDSFEQSFLRQLDVEVSEKLTRWPCLPDELESLVMVRAARTAPFFVTEGSEGERARSLDRVKNAAALSLACNPYSTTSWVMLAWAELLTSGDHERVLKYLDLSYQTGPREYVASLRRVELAILLWDDLDISHKRLIGDQMRILVEGGNYMFVAGFYTSMADEGQTFVRDIFAQSLDEIDQKNLEAAVWAMGATISLPLVKPRGDRPWR